MTTFTTSPGKSAAIKVLAPALWVLFAVLLLATAALALAGKPVPGLQVTIAALTLFVGALVATFSARYMRGDRRQTEFFLSLGGVVGAVLVFVLAGHAIALAIGWLASGVLLSRLIGHGESCREARAASLRALRTFLVGDAAVIAGLGLLGWHAQSWQIDAMIAASPSMPPLPLGIAGMLLLAGAAARCALPPFSNWLLSSMTAPTPVSALMHAGLVNAGGFLLLRFAPVLEAAPAVRYAAVALGFIAALWGIGIMIVRPDIKRSLAGSTVSQMGFMIMSCGLGAYAAALWHLVAHGLFKAWLFLNAGSAVGLRPDRRPTLDARSVTIVAVLTLAIGTALALSGTAGADLVPLLLATATAIATLASIVSGAALTGSRAVLLLALSGLAGLHILGFAAARAVFGHEGDALLGTAASVALLAAFLACWAWQSHRIEKRRPLPAPLYVRLLNAGTLRPIHAGDRP